MSTRRLFALSDIHVDFDENRAWVQQLSRFDYTDDVLLLAGDVSDFPHLLLDCLQQFSKCFHRVLFVPGNHDLWVERSQEGMDSLQKLGLIRRMAEDCGVLCGPWREGDLLCVPLQGWYDYSFAAPSSRLLEAWMDFVACRWPEGMREAAQICAHFLQQNEALLDLQATRIVSFSHFMPRPDLFPENVPPIRRLILPVLGSLGLDAQLRRLGSRLHLYGHSHLNRQVWRDGVLYVNNAFAYPRESNIAAKQLLCLDPLLQQAYAGNVKS